ncbi:MAG: 30S ribosomal protein S7 [Flavobacteriales bacterium]|nr:30S ribosomal protein S7 [Flavobacteriales bacterium]|tara:strand:- start:2789 stop:3259 length:471 start_codon:yes stop_codon:yes gene_type:complete
MRKSRAKKRMLLPDPKFGSVLVTRFVNNLMLDGKKSIAFKVFYNALDVVATKVEEEDALVVWEKSLENITPHVEVRSRRIGGATFQIPQPVRDDRKISLGMKWLIAAARSRNEKTMAVNLASEIVAGYKEEGSAYKKKMDTHRMAEANKAFSHFRF